MILTYNYAYSLNCNNKSVNFRSNIGLRPSNNALLKTDIGMSKTFIYKSPYCIAKRCMWTARGTIPPRIVNGLTPIPRISPTSYLRSCFPKRCYPGEFLPGFYKKGMVPCSNSKEIPTAEKHHLKIVTKDGLVIGLFTSSPRNQETGEMYHFLSKEKYDGTVAPMFNSDGTQNDDGQYISFLKEPLLLSDPRLLGIDIAKQSYCDRHEDLIRMLYTIHGPKNPQMRGRNSKDDALLFDENGQRDKENFP